MTVIETEVAGASSGRGRSLDDWYTTINRIYLLRNLERDSPFMFMHLVEVCGAFRPGRREAATHSGASSALELTDVVPKALAWWFALCAKVGVRSVEDVVWMKFPAACPYCFSRPHDPSACKPTQMGPDWGQLEEVAESNSHRRPTTIAEFAETLAEVYARPEHLQEAIARLVEELGELGEAVRVFDVAPHFFLNEAPDVFAWLIQCHRLIVEEGDFALDLEGRVAIAYPDKCVACEQSICACPPVLKKHRGRLAAEGPNLLAAYRPRGRFLNRSEMVELVRAGTATINVAGHSVVIDLPEWAAIAGDVAFIRDWLVQHGAREDQIASLSRVVDWVAHSEVIQETRLVEIQSAIDEALLALTSSDSKALWELALGVASNFVAAVLMGQYPSPPAA